MNNCRVFGIVTAILFFGTLSSTASAYIDAGTGSLALQAILSGVLGAAFVFRSFWATLFRRKKNENTLNPPPEV